MPTVNGITITGSQYSELKRLVRIELDGGRAADKALPPNHGVYQSLYDRGLIEGVRDDAWSLDIRLTGITQAGLDFVADVEGAKVAESEEKESDRRHDYLVALSGCAGSFVLGLVTEHFTGAIGMLLSFLG